MSYPSYVLGFYGRNNVFGIPLFYLMVHPYSPLSSFIYGSENLMQDFPFELSRAFLSTYVTTGRIIVSYNDAFGLPDRITCS